MIPIYTNKENIMKKLKIRSTSNNDSYLVTVKEIIKDVIKNKDKAIIKYTKKFDCSSITNLVIEEKELKEAYESLDDEMKDVLLTTKKRVIAFHKKQVKTSWMDDELGQIITPIEKIGVYIPGGTASLFSTVFMTVLPGLVAGVKEIVLTTPPNEKDEVRKELLASAYLCGIKRVYKAGGAQAIAAMAYGTETIPAVDKIYGPGNIFVSLAKKEVFGKVGIDSFAGPSEILIIADEKTNPSFVAADLLSQAEHDVLASSILLTTDISFAKKVQKKCEEYIKILSRKEIITKSFEDYSGIIIVKSIDEAINISNSIAPEHLELILENPKKYLPKIKNAGAIFLGEYTPEALGDYMAGPSHVLPTNGTVRFSSPLNVDDFTKKMSVINFTKKKFNILSNKVIRFASEEGLDAHALSVKVRTDNND